MQHAQIAPNTWCRGPRPHRWIAGKATRKTTRRTVEKQDPTSELSVNIKIDFLFGAYIDLLINNQYQTMGRPP